MKSKKQETPVKNRRLDGYAYILMKNILNLKTSGDFGALHVRFHEKMAFMNSKNILVINSSSISCLFYIC